MKGISPQTTLHLELVTEIPGSTPATGNTLESTNDDKTGFNLMFWIMSITRIIRVEFVKDEAFTVLPDAESRTADKSPPYAKRRKKSFCSRFKSKGKAVRAGADMAAPFFSVFTTFLFEYFCECV